MWITDHAGNKALIDDGDEQMWTRLHGWSETAEPAGNQQVWMSHPDVSAPGLVSWGARAYWEGIGWAPSAPPPAYNPTKDPTLTDTATMAQQTPPDGTVAEVTEWVAGDPGRARAALAAEERRDNPRSTLTDSLQRTASADDSAAPAAPSTEE